MPVIMTWHTQSKSKHLERSNIYYIWLKKKIFNNKNKTCDDKFKEKIKIKKQPGNGKKSFPLLFLFFFCI